MSIQEAFNLITTQTGAQIDRLVFGDLHLKDIRQWRVDTWPQYLVHTPLFDLPYEELLSQLWQLQKTMDLEITLSSELAMPKEVLAVGTPYTEELVQQIKDSGLDAMLENGEAHTLVFPKGWKKY